MMENLKEQVQALKSRSELDELLEILCENYTYDFQSVIEHFSEKEPTVEYVDDENEKVFEFYEIEIDPAAWGHDAEREKALVVLENWNKGCILNILLSRETDPDLLAYEALPF